MSADAAIAGVSTAPIPACAGIGFRAPHYRELIATLPAIGWLEVHSENFFGLGGQPWHYLERARRDYPVSLHGVGLSLGSADGLDAGHLTQLKRLCRRIEPVLVSEHLCWNAIGRRHVPDLLPLPYTDESWRCVRDNILRTQDSVGRPILIENISRYVNCTHSYIPEAEFMAALVGETGCGILLDINNLYVNFCNHGDDPHAFMRALPAKSVREYHLAGFTDTGDGLIDTHGTEVATDVWALFRAAVTTIGARPALIEWDVDVPALPVLLQQARIAQGIIDETCTVSL